MVLPANDQPQVAIVVPSWNGREDTLARPRSFPTPFGALAHFSRIGRWKKARARLSQYRAPTVERGSVDPVNGAFALMRCKTLDEVGLFDGMCMDDLDLCYRFAPGGNRL